MSVIIVQTSFVSMAARARKRQMNSFFTMPFRQVVLTMVSLLEMFHNIWVNHTVLSTESVYLSIEISKSCVIIETKLESTASKVHGGTSHDRIKHCPQPKDEFKKKVD